MKKTVVLFCIVIMAGTTLYGAKGKKNLVANGTFEEPSLDEATTSMLNPDDWQIYASPKGLLEMVGISAEQYRSGVQSMLIRSTGTEHANQGAWMQVTVTGRKKYVLEVYVLNDSAMPIRGDSRAELVIEWKDGEGLEVARAIGPSWDQRLSKKFWKRQRMIVTAPRNAEEARIVLTYSEGANAEADSVFYVDDILFYEK